MTSSFSGHAAGRRAGFDLIDPAAESVAQLARSAGEVLAGTLPLIGSLARERFERIVYLGSDSLKGLAREAALKTLELSDGQVVAMSDTPLGFRHGPKTIVNGRSLVVVLLCNDPYTRRYEVDLLHELRTDGVAARVLALTAQPMQEPRPADDVAATGAPRRPISRCACRTPCLRSRWRSCNRFPWASRPMFRMRAAPSIAWCRESRSIPWNLPVRTYLGIDGGGSKTEFLLIDESGRVLATRREGPAYYLETGVDALKSMLADGIHATLAQGAVPPAELTFAFLGLPAYGEDSRLACRPRPGRLARPAERTLRLRQRHGVRLGRCPGRP